jgi:hypothetical protein
LSSGPTVISQPKPQQLALLWHHHGDPPWREPLCRTCPGYSEQEMGCQLLAAGSLELSKIISQGPGVLVLRDRPQGRNSSPLRQVGTGKVPPYLPEACRGVRVRDCGCWAKPRQSGDPYKAGEGGSSLLLMSLSSTVGNTHTHTHTHTYPQNMHTHATQSLSPTLLSKQSSGNSPGLWPCEATWMTEMSCSWQVCASARLQKGPMKVVVE